jgi:5'-3' exonuclease
MTDEQKPTIDDLKDSVAGLAAFRRDADIVDATYKAKQALFEEENEDLIKRRADVKEARDAMEATVRKMQLANPSWFVEGVEVTDGKKVTEYADEYAVDWCVYHHHVRLLKLVDRKTFEKVAILAGDLKVEKVLKVKISSDLSNHLEGEQHDED